MNKQLKSLINALVFLYFFLEATKGIVRLLWNTKEPKAFDARVKLLSYLTPLFSFIYIIAIYHLVGHSRVEPFYKVFIGLIFLYFFLGILYNELYNLFSKFKK